jgi:hypothetical protein
MRPLTNQFPPPPPVVRGCAVRPVAVPEDPDAPVDDVPVDVEDPEVPVVALAGAEPPAPLEDVAERGCAVPVVLLPVPRV